MNSAANPLDRARVEAGKGGRERLGQGEWQKLDVKLPGRLGWIR